jgi:hypothetical protein
MDVYQKTFKFLADYFWQGVHSQKKTESISAKLKHENNRLS